MENDLKTAGVIEALTVALAHLYARHFAAIGATSAEAAQAMHKLANDFEDARRAEVPDGDAKFEAVQWGTAQLDHLAELVKASLKP